MDRTPSSVWDYPVTDTELDNFYGIPQEPPAHDAVCNAIRAIHYNYFERETIQAILATLAAKIKDSPFTKDRDDVIETLDIAFQQLD